MQRIGWIVGLLAVLAATSSSAHAQKRVALVIGNSAYQHTSQLSNPRNDATDMVAALMKHGFQVIEGFDLDKAAFERKVRDFSGALKGAEAGLFFYAGHGLQVGGQNYLVPIDAKAESEDALDWEMLKVDVVHRAMERSTNTNILFLDACRDNPLARNLARAMGTRSAHIGRGLATIESGVGTLISFSTQPGNVALDGTGRNSPFAGALIKQLSSSSDDLSAMLISVRNDVMKETQRKQVPWEHSALTGRFYFRSAPGEGQISQTTTGHESEAAKVWASIKESSNQAVLEAFIKQFDNTVYSAMARGRVEDLGKSAPQAEPSKQAAAKLAMPKSGQSAAREEPITFTRVVSLGCQPAYSANDRLRFDIAGGTADAVKAIQIKAYGTQVDIEDVSVSHIGGGVASRQKGTLVLANTASVPIRLESGSKPLSLVFVSYSSAARPHGSSVPPSLCVEGLS